METKTASTVPVRRLSAWCEFSLCSKSTSMSVTVTTMRRGLYCPCQGTVTATLLCKINIIATYSHVLPCSSQWDLQRWRVFTLSLKPLFLSIFSCRAFRGKHITLIVRFPNQGRQVDDLDIWSHTNDTIGSVRRGILNRIKANAAHTKIELFIGGEVVDPADDRKLIGQLNLKDKTVRMLDCCYSFSSRKRNLFIRGAVLPPLCFCICIHIIVTFTADLKWVIPTTVSMSKITLILKPKWWTDVHHG